MRSGLMISRSRAIVTESFIRLVSIGIVSSSQLIIIVVGVISYPHLHQ